MISKGTRVRLEDYTGTVQRKHRIRVHSKMETVYSVHWDGNPEWWPVQWRDEDGSNVRGYLESDLEVLN